MNEFLSAPMLLEAALVRCAQNRDESRYDPECINAREAVKVIEAREEAERREGLEAQSQAKRDALRRTQRAAAEARRRSADAARRREEAEYLAQFGELPPSETGTTVDGGANAPQAVIPDAIQDETDRDSYDDVYNDYATYDTPEVTPPVQEGNAPVAEIVPEPEAAPDLNAIRDELRRRNEDDGNN